MSNISTDNVQQAREEVAALEATRDDLKRALADSEASRNNEVRVSALDRQKSDLRAEIEQLRSQLTVSKNLESLPIVSDTVVVEPEVTGLADVSAHTTYSQPTVTEDLD